jgi:hypothetical protein
VPAEQTGRAEGEHRLARSQYRLEQVVEHNQVL